MSSGNVFNHLQRATIQGARNVPPFRWNDSLDRWEGHNGTGYVPLLAKTNKAYHQTDLLHYYANAGAQVGVEMDDFEISITPTTASSDIELTGSFFGELTLASTDWNHMLYVVRKVDGEADVDLKTKQGLSDTTNGITCLTNTEDNNADSTPCAGHFTYIDSPATTKEVTYVPVFLPGTATGNFRLNSTSNTTTNNNSYERGMSMFMAKEI